MMTSKRRNPVFVLVTSLFYSLVTQVLCCSAVKTITTGQVLRDGDTLLSDDEKFELGFFSLPGSSVSRYVGIRYHNDGDQAVLWTANREKPLLDRNGVLTISDDGNLNVLNEIGHSVWSSNVSVPHNENRTVVAVIESTGNLILKGNGSNGNVIYWQSLYHLSDTFLPDLTLLVSSDVLESRVFTSWKSEDDPTPGNFTMGVDTRGAPQIVIWENSDRRWRSGHWNLVMFTGIPNMTSLTNYLYGFRIDQLLNGNISIMYKPVDTSDLMRFRITWDGYEEQLQWNQSAKDWELVQQKHPANQCELYNHCGNFGVCSVSGSAYNCDCMSGFVPTNQDQWTNGNWTGGCKRRTPLTCSSNTSMDGFKELRCMKLPDFAEVESRVSMDTCRQTCLHDCSCNAFAHVIGIGCMIWKGELVDVQEFDDGGSVMFVRLAASELGENKLPRLVIAMIVVAAVVVVAISVWLLIRLKSKFRVSPTATSTSGSRDSQMPVYDIVHSLECSTDHSGSTELAIEGSQQTSPDLPLYNINCLSLATNKFSEANKLGQGGFGPVYKGMLPGGQEIAVKRLSRRSGQGLEEFKNEMILIAKLQHRNLVRLLGCCIQPEDKMLVYEYMPNKSLDCFIFDPAKREQIDWRKRYVIIEGIARGLLYLHRDSRLRIIHRDLKASNVLLDEEMNPKISDFGMARIFGGNQNEANTNRVVGTYGYMAPEYAMEGLFSVKSDVYSFGVLLLEIISGRRNTSFRLSNHVSLVGYAWDLWSEGRAMELVDILIRDSCSSEEEVLRCIHIGMLCVQDSATHRPTMASVLLMLETNMPSPLPLPRQPTFTSMRASVDTHEFSMDAVETASCNDLTVTTLVGR